MKYYRLPILLLCHAQVPCLIKVISIQKQKILNQLCKDLDLKVFMMKCRFLEVMPGSRKFFFLIFDNHW
jgi:hypothetical protein